ncbi:MAG: Gfo/Idh/MocA family oxidoreductase [Anaerolineae bacterium]|nr:Gfo/Idh/MocA family oxidoreductase [Anaerolineae bacterium]
MFSQEPIRLAIIGAGVFARDSHLPAIQALAPAFDVVAVGSRTQRSAEALAALLPGKVDTYTDLAALLARDDIEAVDILLPIDTMPAVVEQALQAGKHVISEKPVAPDVAAGRALLAAQPSDKVWMVAENFRYEEAFLEAAGEVQRGAIGKLIMCHWAVHVNMAPGNKYYDTDWRRFNRFPGGFIMDGGVHFAAGLRMILGEIASVTAVVAQQREDLPPADTLCATLRFDSGVIGSFSSTHTVDAPWPSALRIVGDKGAISVHRDELEITSSSGTRSQTFARDGIKHEFAAFAEAIGQGQPHRNSAAEALQDVAIIEAMLLSAQTGGAVEPQRVV